MTRITLDVANESMKTIRVVAAAEKIDEIEVIRRGIAIYAKMIELDQQGWSIRAVDPDNVDRQAKIALRP